MRAEARVNTGQVKCCTGGYGGAFGRGYGGADERDYCVRV